MDIESVSHKALRRFIETGSARLVGDVVRLGNMISLIDAAASLAELALPPNYGLHQMTGNRDGTWSMKVTRNWRLTFLVNEDGALTNLDLEDYHGG